MSNEIKNQIDSLSSFYSSSSQKISSTIAANSFDYFIDSYQKSKFGAENKKIEKAVQKQFDDIIKLQESQQQVGSESKLLSGEETEALREKYSNKVYTSPKSNSSEDDMRNSIRTSTEGTSKLDSVSSKNSESINPYGNNDDISEELEGSSEKFHEDVFSSKKIKTKTSDIDIRDTASRRFILSGIDFISNQFDANLLVYTKGTEKYTDLINEYNNQIGEPDLIKPLGFLIRYCNVTVPQMEAGTFNFKNGITNIEKVATKFRMENKSMINLRIDQDLLCYDMMNYLSNNNENGEISERGTTLTTPFSTVRYIENLKSKTRIDLIVKHKNLAGDSRYSKRTEDLIYSANGHLESAADSKLPDDDSMLWLFEDVNFLGFSDGVPFDNEGSSDTTLNLEFIFKRLIRVDPTPSLPRKSIVASDGFFATLNNVNNDSSYEGHSETTGVNELYQSGIRFV